MPDERDNRRAERAALRERIRLVHAEGIRAHQRFTEAHAAQDREGMRQASREHTACTAEVLTLIARLRA